MHSLPKISTFCCAVVVRVSAESGVGCKWHGRKVVHWPHHRGRRAANLARSANLPEGIYILLALISFFLLFFYYEQSYLSIYWTEFHDLFIKLKVFA